MMKPGKIRLGTPVNSFIEIGQGNNYLFGKFVRSPNQTYLSIFKDGKMIIQEKNQKWQSGIVCLLKEDNLLWWKEFERPVNVSIGNDGTAVILHTIYRSASNSKPEPGKDLGGSITVTDVKGDQLFKKDFTSNVEACSISEDSKHALVATLFPDNTLYCFELEKKKLLWEYKNHDRKPILGIKFSNNKIQIFTGGTTSSQEIRYELTLDGKLVEQFANELQKFQSLKNLPIDESIEPLLSMLKTGSRNDIANALSQLRSIVYNKKSFGLYPIIVENLLPILKTKDKEVFDLLWKVIRVISRKKPDSLDAIIPNILHRLKEMPTEYHDPKLYYYTDLASAKPKWLETEYSYILNTLTSSKRWNDRRFAAFVIGAAGAKDPNFVKNAIPTLIEYVKFPEKISEFVEKNREKIEVSFDIQGQKYSIDFSNLASEKAMGVDPGTWLRDACIDALGEIGESSPIFVKDAVPILEELANKAPTPYTMAKAKRAISKIKK